MNGEKNKLCPSAIGSEGALLLGVVTDDMTVSLLQPPLPVNNAFIEEAKRHGPLEKRFRFANKCVKCACRQWTGSRCGVSDILVNANKSVETDETLRPCHIRNRCRWFSQNGKAACTICPYVVTNNLEEFDRAHPELIEP